jgi:hypothetical protein
MKVVVFNEIYINYYMFLITDGGKSFLEKLDWTT